MSLTGTLAGVVRAVLPGVRSAPRCPACAADLEPPAPHPLTDTPARRCPSCGDWFPAAGRRPYAGD